MAESVTIALRIRPIRSESDPRPSAEIIFCMVMYRYCHNYRGKRLNLSLSYRIFPPKRGEAGKWSRPFYLDRSVFAVVELKPELNACLISEIALIVVSVGEGVAKASKQIIKFNRANIEASTNNEIEGIVARRFTGH
jgi:hypothetical protein